MKVLVAIDHLRQSTDSFEAPANACVALLKNMGYEVEKVILQQTSTYISGTVAADTSDYAFVVIPALADTLSASHALYDVFDLDIPVFVLVISGSSKHTALVGADTFTSATYLKIDYPAVADLYFWSGTMEIMAGHEDYVTVLGTDSADSSKLVFWKRIESGKAPVYCHAGWASTGLQIPLPILIKQAIIDGHISGSKLPPQKLKSMFDIDDIPNATTNLADLQNIIDVQDQYGWPVTWGLKTGNASQPGGSDIWGINVTAAQKALIASNTPDKGGYVYAISHNHNWEWDMSMSPVDTKAEMDVEYRIDVARAIADGISMGNTIGGLDSRGYIYFPVNHTSDEAYQLGSPQTSKLSDPDNVAVQVGYGWKAARLHAGNSVAGGYGSSNKEQGIQYHRGMVLLNGSFRLGASDINYVVGSATEYNQFANTFSRWFVECMAFDAVHFWHGVNFYDGHDGGNAPGIKIMRLIGTWGAWMGDIHEFIHPSTYASRLNLPVGNPIDL